jgi:hypothetical protein
MGEPITIENGHWIPPDLTGVLPDVIDETLPPKLEEKLFKRLYLVGQASGDLAMSQTTELEPATQVTEDEHAPFDYHPLKDEATIRYPDLEFNFNHKWLFRSGVIEPSLQSRTRAVLYAARDASEQEGIVDLKWPDMAMLEKQAKSAQLLAKKEVTIAPRIQVKREQVLSFEHALEIVSNRFARENHPIYQALQDLQQRFTPEDLPSSMIHQIERTLYAGLAYRDIESIYQRALKKVKSNPRLLKSFA